MIHFVIDKQETVGGTTLAWIKSARAFLKVQAGTGDNLLEEDIREGFTDYCLWPTFRPECIDINGELDMECLDSGMILFRGTCGDAQATLRACYAQAFGKDFAGNNCIAIIEQA